MSGLHSLGTSMVVLCLTVPLAGLWAFPQRRWVWMYPLMAVPIASELLTDPADFVEPIGIALGAVPRALAVLVPVAMVAGEFWPILRHNVLFWLLVLAAVGLVAYVVTIVIMGEAWMNKDAMYCWNPAEATTTDCALNPWLLASVGLGYGGLAVILYGTIPALAILGFAGWWRRRRSRQPVAR